MDCPVCFAEARALATGRRRFHRCAGCGFVWAADDSRPDPAAAERRYRLHRNSSDDAGYVRFLDEIHDKVLDRIRAAVGTAPRTILDWGSGPNPIGAERLRMRGFDVSIWDPLFAAAESPPPAAFDLVVCVEVAEHFHEPIADFHALAARVKPGGFLAIHTHFAPMEDEAFLKWWYIEDPTHVAFYTEKALRWLSEDESLAPSAFLDGRLALFRRPLPILAVGGIVMDIEGRPFGVMRPGDSNPGSVRLSSGGVARNAAENLSRLGLATELVGIVGDDIFGRMIQTDAAAAGIGLDGLDVRSGAETASYLSILESDGRLAAAVSGLALYDGLTAPDLLVAVERAATACSVFQDRSAESFAALLVDANLPPAAVDALLARFPRLPVWFDPVSVAKAERFAAYDGGRLFKRFDYVKPNQAEVLAINAVLGLFADGTATIKSAAALATWSGAVIWLSRAEHGLAVIRHDRVQLAVAGPIAPLSVTGAGDALLAAALRAETLGLSPWTAASQALAAARLTLMTSETCPPLLSARELRIAGTAIDCRCLPLPDGHGDQAFMRLAESVDGTIRENGE